MPALGQEAGTRPPVEFIVIPGEASAVTAKLGVAWANGGVIAVDQPNPTTLVITMSGITATNADLCATSVANYRFELTQGFAVNFNSPLVTGAKLTLESRVLGLLRGHTGSLVRGILVERLVLEQRGGERVQARPLGLQQLGDTCVGLLDDPPHLLVDQPLGLLADLRGAGEERAALAVAGDQRQRPEVGRHPPPPDHLAGDPRQLLDV